MVKKIHARRRRYMPVRAGRNRKPRPRSFPSEERAKQWADAHGVTNYTFKNLRAPESKTKKIVLLQK